MTTSDALDPAWLERFAGIDRLYGAGTVARMAGCRVAVVGMGGVGSWVAEALARTGAGHLTLIDADDLCVSNTNRQLPALAGQYGRVKVEAMAERCRAINPHVTVEAIASFVTPSNLEEMLDRGFDLVIDACDSFRTKVVMAAWCRRRKLPLIVVGSAGGRTDATLVRAARSIPYRARRHACAGAQEAAQRVQLPRRTPTATSASQAIYSLENVKYPQPDGSVCGVRPQVSGDAALKLDCGAGLGAATHITGTFAFAAVGRAMGLLLKRKDAARERLHVVGQAEQTPCIRRSRLGHFARFDAAQCGDDVSTLRAGARVRCAGRGC